ncbi:MAG TPA: TetR/AcrR family transcriptional regulator, partial [Hymenobacter sp.]|nr:TetR/AcrR family transcriptional regulator [Hymenobacter sp.]
EHLYSKNPADSEIGRRLLMEAVRLVDEIGFEQFTFKKLATSMGSSEATLYRYFDNKHQLLNYLVSWY